MTGSAGSAVDVLSSAIAFFNRRRVREEVRGDFAGSEGRRIHFMFLFGGSFSSPFSLRFWSGFGYPLALLFRSKSWKNRGSGRLAAGMEKGSEKGVIFEGLEPRKVSSRRGGSTILRF